MTDSMVLRDERMKQRIELNTEPEENIPGFILGNALCPVCQKPTPVNEFVARFTPNPCECDPPTIAGRHPVVRYNEAKGQQIVICGAGPSLNQFRPFIEKFKGEIWGTNRALNYLHGWGVTKAKGVAIDPSTRLFGEVWTPPPETEYLLATSVNPGLVWAIEALGYPIRYFHSYRGVADEVALYQTLYPPTALASFGLNVPNRAVDVAEFMGFRRIYLAGCDLALGENDKFYAGGEEGHNKDDVTLEGSVDGKHFFRTKTDMLMSAVELARKRRRLKTQGVKLTFLGNTLPRALQNQPESVLRRVIDWR